MPLSGTSIRIFFLDLDSTLGVYVNEPGIDPYICLNTSLETTDHELKQMVYLALINFHLGLNPSYRLFPLVKTYEDLTRAKPVEQLQEQKPEVIILGRAKGRNWYCTSCGEPFTTIRIIGKEAG